jgi:hypothetical protein
MVDQTIGGRRACHWLATDTTFNNEILRRLAVHARPEYSTNRIEFQMHKSWLTGLTVAGVVGSGGAAFAELTAPVETVPAPQMTEVGTRGSTVPVVDVVDQRPLSVSYQLDPIGSLRAQNVDGTLRVADWSVSPEWSVSVLVPEGARIEVQFTDGVQAFMLAVDLVDGAFVPTVTQAVVPSASAIAAPAQSPAPAPAPAPVPAQPAAVPAQAPTPALGATTTSIVASTHSTSPSGSGDDDDEHEDEDDREGEDDHEDEGDGDDD